MTVDRFLDLLGPFASDPIVIAIALGLFTFVLEDAATTIGALLAAMHIVPASYVLIALYTGIVLGDFGLYGLGWLAARNEKARRFISEDRIGKAQKWLENHLFSTLIGVRFAPGIRLPTYTGAGFLGVSFVKFSLIVLIAAGLWTVFLFSAVYFFGQMIIDIAGTWGWIAGMVIAICFFTFPYIRDYVRRPKAA